MEDSELKGKVALVTGSAVRIGRAIALALSGRGASLAIHYGRSAAAAAMTVAEIRDLGGSAEAFQADLRDLTRTKELIGEVAQTVGEIDILVNSAAVYATTEFANTSESIWDEQFTVNLKAPFFLAQAFSRHVGKTRSGQIINIADWRAVRPDPRSLAYSLSKGGIVTMTEGLALALAPNIRVNAIAPGAILPPKGRDETFLRQMAGRIPLLRHGTPGDVAGALIFLATAQFVTGQVLYVDGGAHLGGYESETRPQGDMADGR